MAMLYRSKDQSFNKQKINLTADLWLSLCPCRYFIQQVITAIAYYGTAAQYKPQ